MKTKLLFTIAALLGLSLVPALPSDAQRSNPCIAAPAVKPSRETRQIRVEKYGIAFNIPENYRTRSNIAENNMSIAVYSPSAFEFNECMRINKIPSDNIYAPSAIFSIDSLRSGKNLIDIANERLSRYANTFREITFKNEPAISFEYRNLADLYDAVLFFLPNRKSSVAISINRENKTLGEAIKSSFTFDLSSSPNSEAVNNDDLITVVQTKTCQLLNQGSSISDVVSNVKPTVKKLDEEYLFIHANLSRKMHSESGNDVDIVTRRMIGGAIKRDCPQFQNKLTEYYKSNFSSNTQPVNSKPESTNGKFVGTRECGPYDGRDTRPQPPKAQILEANLDYRNNVYTLSLQMSDQTDPVKFILNSKLALAERWSYSDPMKISPDGKFRIGINGRSNWCSYSGIAQISPEASTRLFGKRADETSVRPSNANPPQPPLRLKLEPESPKIW